jgi:hypothetical protein
MADDINLRQVLDLPQGKRCAAFDKLRKEYPIRREFQNTKVIFDKALDKIKGIGFKSD